MPPAASSLPAVLPMAPFTAPARAEVRVPGSKSLTNRALLLAALCQRPVLLTGALFSEDTHLMVEALRSLGFTIDAAPDSGEVRVSGQANAFPAERRELFVGLAGTAARFLTALCAAAPRGIFHIDGIPQMRKRPMKGLIDALRALGADIRCLGEEGFFPIEIHARGIAGGPVSIDARESSQMLSALLMVAPLARKPIKVSLIGGVRWPFVAMTAKLMEHFGQPAVRRLDADRFVAESGHVYSVSGDTYAIEPDATAASYFLALPRVVGGSVRLPGLRGAGAGLQGDTAFIGIVEALGLRVQSDNGCLLVDLPHSAPAPGLVRDFSEFSDTFLTLAAIAPLLSSPTRISGIAHTRKQETDRVAGMARELTRLGQEVVETEDSLEIRPRPLLRDQVIETYGDHRFAMSFGILGSLDLRGDGQPWLSIRNPACCAKTFPDFFSVLEQVRLSRHP
ncbi:3-phosphoshikimate 1-carboxyvinyltransferase [Nibricoccus sp. IMCC34717]|uniref:3-phosphoshikimate 1-carboxyvinyltransferase n=1 Tax=Nibricoccus sp. IMCC34717 TaxID=3034021 RepID=UPI00384B035F